MNINNFFSELKRRNVYKVAVAYVIAAWLIIQAASILLPTFEAPAWAMKVIVMLLVLGFPAALIFSWAFEMTPEGIVRESDIAAGKSITHHTRRKTVALIALLAVIAAGLFVFQLVRSRSTTAESPNVSAIPNKSIAVLPFENLSDDKQNAYFADGIQDEILTKLTSIADLKVISRTSTRRFKSAPDNVREIAQQLGVAHLLEGSVQKSNDQVRVNVQLINASKDSHVWAETYDRKLNDIFGVEAEIATSIADMLQVKLTGSAKRLLAARPTENPQAHQLYLQGVFYHARGSKADYDKAIDFFRNAVRLDPRYALAWAELSISWLNLSRKFLNGDAAQAAYAQALAAAESALALDPNLTAAHTARGLVLESANFDWKGAEAEFRRAIELAPHDDSPKTTLADLLATMGHPERAVELAREELTSDPLCASCYHWLASYLSPLDRLDEAEQAILKAIELQPGHADFYTQLTVIAIQRGDAKAALDAAQKEVEAGGWQDIALALAQQISGDAVAADVALKKLIDSQANDAGYQIAQVYALRNDPEKVFEWLDRAWSNRDAGISGLLYDPLLLRYKDDPRFATYCQKVGLPPPIISAKP
jgi:TolB-like protein/Tfp pilus assembly protein PilF